MAGIGIVVNPTAGGNRRVAERTERLARAVGTDGEVREAERLEQLTDVARDFRARGIDVLGVCGGDGSFFRALSAFASVYDGETLPVFLPLRAGTMNTVARGVGAPRGRPERVLERLLARYRRGEAFAIASRQLVCVNRSMLGFMAGAGTIVSFLQAYYAGRVQGPLGAAQLLARLATSALNGSRLIEEVVAWVDAEVCCDGERLPFERFSVIYASTITDIGLGFRPTYLADDARGCFHFLAGPLEAMQALRCLPSIRRGRPTGSRQLYDHLGRCVTVEFREPKPYMIDGDVMEPAARFTIEVGPVVRIATEDEER